MSANYEGWIADRVQQIVAEALYEEETPETIILALEGAIDLLRSGELTADDYNPEI